MNLGLLIGICVLGLIVLGAWLVSLGDESNNVSKKKKKKRDPEQMPKTVDDKDWIQETKRLERQLNGAHKKIESLEQQIAQKDAKIDLQNKQAEDLLKKLSQEKSWREKEEDFTHKSREREKNVHLRLKQIQQELSDKESSFILQERELRHYKKEHSDLTNKNRQLETKVMRFEEALSKKESELRDCRRENRDLSKKKEAEVWVAKEEYELLQEKLKDIQARIKHMDEEKKATEERLKSNEDNTS